MNGVDDSSSQPAALLPTLDGINYTVDNWLHLVPVREWVLTLST